MSKIVKMMAALNSEFPKARWVFDPQEDGKVFVTVERLIGGVCKYRVRVEEVDNELRLFGLHPASWEPKWDSVWRSPIEAAMDIHAWVCRKDIPRQRVVVIQPAEVALQP